MSDNEDQGPRRSSRSRAKASKNADVFEKLKQIRREGRVHREDVDELIPDLYEEVDEVEYAEKFCDDFVVDDDGSGYVDNGQDDDEDPYYATNEKEQKKKERRAGKVKKGAIDSFFSAVIPSKNEFEPVATEKVDEDLNEMLAQIAGSDNIYDDFIQEREPEDEFIPTPNNKFKRNRPFSPDATSFTPPSKLPRKQIKLTKKAQPIVAQKSPAFPPVSSTFDDNRGYDFDYNDLDIAPSPPSHSPVSKKEESVLSKKFNRELSFEDEKLPETPKKPFETSEKNDLSQIDFDESKLKFFEGEDDSLPQPTVITDSDVSKTGYFNETRSLRFFWFDAYEDAKHPGRVYLFGFVKKDGVFEFESCCITIDKIFRRVFFVKRDCDQENDEPVSDLMLYKEVNDLLVNHYKFTSFKCKTSLKKFAFMDGITPEEASCLQVCYDSSYPMLPSGPYNGKTFNRIANASVTAMERLLIEREIMGPCWLEITDVDEVHMGEKLSYCQREFKTVASKVELDLVNIMPNMQHSPLPPCRMMALNIITIACPKTNKPLIVMMTVLRSSTYFLDRRTPTKWDQRITFVSLPPGASFPLQFQQDAEKRQIQIEKCSNEKSMLQRFLGSVKMFDPDVVLGHDIAAQMSILRDRLEDNKLVTVNWSFMGRLKRQENLKYAPQNKSFRWSWTAGRLYLDSKAAAMELVHSQSYDLDELVTKVLTPIVPNAKRLPIDTEMISKVFYENNGKTEPIFNLIQWSFWDACFSHEILAQLNAAQLFLQITQIVGGVLSRTLLGGRAERNEYLLLHAFYREGYVAPDRVTFKQKAKQVKQDATSENAAGEETVQQQQPTSKKAQYTGGLVLEPKKGLYETFIVLLDFNSLYPSIIQEFNICFTTVKLDQTKAANESDLPPIPDSSLEQGILPKEIAKLVRSRRDVKNDMKKVSDKKCEKYKQMDIRQLGLKLTANSMYGCLGFEGSRFCAKTLAAMITSKGREILESTRNLVENKGYSVIYGDTDSIMVNTNSVNLVEAKNIGYTIKSLINKSYKQLTLDIDGVYKRLLLLKKKKYAGLAIDLSNELKISKELKGLDIVRRDWSFLARQIGDKVVDIILQSNGRDEMVEEIRKTLSEVKEGIEQRTIPLEKFEILKKLTHRPEDYRDAKSQPHVLVALRLNQTKNANLRQNDIVKYIICDDGSGQAATQRAYARIEIEANNNLKIDASYYLAHQIHPVVSRLCEPIEEMDACQVAEALGLDGTHYRRRLIDQIDEDANDENISPGIVFNFNVCDGLPIQCPSCKHIDIHRTPLYDDKIPSFAECTSCHYCLLNDPIKVELQIIDFLQKNCKKYSECKYICDDVVCGFELDFPPVFKNEFGFPCTECSHGFFKPNYTLKRLFDQQNFVMKIVDFDEWEAKEATKEQKATVSAYPKVVDLRCYSKEWKKRVSKFISENPYNRVDLSLVFAPMKIL